LDKRKASDVLLVLEGRVEKIESVMAQIDLNVKSILNKLNIGSVGRQVVFDSPPTQPKATPIAGPLVQAPVPTVDNVTFPQVGASSSLNQRNSVVEQGVFYADGRPVILASVTIAEAEITTNIISKVKTNSHGKWHAQLLGGKYIVEVIKGPTAAKRGFKVQYEIEVPGDGKPLSLEGKQVE